MRLLPCPLALIPAFSQGEKEPAGEDRSVRKNRAAALSYSLSLWERVGVRASGRQSNHNVQTASAASALI